MPIHCILCWKEIGGKIKLNECRERSLEMQNFWQHPRLYSDLAKANPGTILAGLWKSENPSTELKSPWISVRSRQNTCRSLKFRKSKCKTWKSLNISLSSILAGLWKLENSKHRTWKSLNVGQIQAQYLQVLENQKIQVQNLKVLERRQIQAKYVLSWPSLLSMFCCFL